MCWCRRSGQEYRSKGLRRGPNCTGQTATVRACLKQCSRSAFVRNYEQWSEEGQTTKCWQRVEQGCPHLLEWRSYVSNKSIIFKHLATHQHVTVTSQLLARDFRSVSLLSLCPLQDTSGSFHQHIQTHSFHFILYSSPLCVLLCPLEVSTHLTNREFVLLGSFVRTQTE